MSKHDIVLTVEQEIRRIVEFTFSADADQVDLLEIANGYLALPHPELTVVDEEILTATILNMEVKESPHVP